MISPPDRSHEPLLRTKLSVPQLRISLVSRPRLLSLLAEGSGCALTLVCAPAGYGKTTLLVEWISSIRREKGSGKPAVCWLSLDEGDNDPARFLGYLITALENEDPALGRHARSVLQSFPPPPLQTVLSILINDLDGLAAPLLLVLDDYQFITNPAIHAGVSFFLDHLPAQVHLVIATRSDPPLPLARLRARSQLVEVRAEHLRFSPAEAAEFLQRVMNLSLSSEDLSILESRTEGWPAGLQMAGLSMQGRSDISQFIATFSGSHRYILDYLAEEVLNRQPEEIQKFLMRTSILDRFCAALCSFVSNEEVAVSQGILEYLDRTNLFLIALDEERSWYRYHHLFADLLRARLQQSHPDWVPQFHRRASEWYDQKEYAAEAIQHAFSALDYERAADLIKRYGTLRWSQGDPTLVTLAGRLPPEVLYEWPRLGIYLSWMMVSQGQSPAALQLLSGVKSHLLSDPSAGPVWIPALIDLLYAYGSLQSKPQDQIVIPDYHALESISEQDAGLRETADFIYTILLNRQGDFEQGAKILERCIRRETTNHGPAAIYALIALLARMRIMQGSLPEAATLCQEYLQPFSAKGKGKRSFYAAGSLNIILGEVLCEWNQLDEAEKEIREGIRDNEPWNNITFDAIGYSDLICVQLAKRDLAGAAETMRKLEEMLQGRTLTLDLEEELWTYKVRIWLATGDLAQASEWAERMPAAGPQDFLQEWGWISYVRVRLAQGKHREALDILETLAQLPGSAKRPHRQVRVELLRAITLSYQNQLPQALQALDACLALTEPGGYIRVFLDSGEVVRELLSAYLQTPTPDHQAYARKLLDAFHDVPPAISPGEPRTDMVERLTDREFEVLRLLAAGLSNRQIADKLILAEGTVKFYVHAILEKLAVHSRTQAIAKARELNLV